MCPMDGDSIKVNGMVYISCWLGRQTECNGGHCLRLRGGVDFVQSGLPGVRYITEGRVATRKALHRCWLNGGPASTTLTHH